MKIYTKSGDNGTTCLYDCSRVSKSSVLIDLLGDIDELNSFIANPKKKYNFDITLEFTKILEKEIDNMTYELPKLSNFILPNGNIHLSRAIARRCERKLVEIKSIYTHIDNNCLIFLNRLSDYLFTLARYDSYMKGESENIYKKSSILTNIIE